VAGYVAQKIHDAERIVLLLKDSAGVRWGARARDPAKRGGQDAVSLDPAIKDRRAWEALATTALPLLQTRSARPPRGSIRIEADRLSTSTAASSVQIVNANRTATSYRTAFSLLPRGATVPG
jgi:hypothetical protein